jgi:hypothetical protein
MEIRRGWFEIAESGVFRPITSAFRGFVIGTKVGIALYFVVSPKDDHGLPN